MWSPTFLVTVLGAALATAAPFTANTTRRTIEPQGCEVYSHIFPDGVAPVNMAEVADPSAEYNKCNIKAYKICKKHTFFPRKGCLKNMGKFCKLKDVVAPVVDKVILPAEEKNKTLPSCGNDFLDFIFKERHERNKTAHGALEPRQQSECPKKCAAWAVLPPFGVFFATCMADCALRCARNLSCP